MRDFETFAQLATLRDDLTTDQVEATWRDLRHRAATALAPFLTPDREMSIRVRCNETTELSVGWPGQPPRRVLQIEMHVTSNEPLHQLPPAPDPPDWRPASVIPEDHL